MSKSDVLMVSKQPPTYMMVPSRTVQADLVTENKIVVYVPIATRDVYGTVKIGDGINIENGTISFDESKVTILSISKNGTNIVPDENKHVNIELSKIDVGLANVDNTSDMYKPISVYQQEALDEKVDVYQGEVNVGKALVVDVYGNVSLQEVSMSLDEDVLSDIAVEIKDDNFNIVKTHLNLKTLAENKQAMNLPLANDTQSGLMSVADYVSIRNLQDRVGRLEFKTTRLLYTDTLYPTPEQIDEFAVSAGYTAPFDGVSIIVDGTNHVWHYYENDIGWKDDGLDVVGQFTNDIAGVIRGSVADGKIYAETDGTGSVYGWDDLKNKVSDLETASKNYVTYTDYATASKVGLIKANSSQGFFISATGDLSLVQAQPTDLVNKKNKFRPLTANNMDEALKVSITTNTIELTDEEKAKAKEWLGVSDGDVEIPVATKDVLGGIKIWYENETLYILTEENAGGDSLVVSPVFGENSPQTISAVAELISTNNMTSQQVYDTYGWSLGDTCDITLSSGETIQMQIIGFNHDDKSDGSGKAGITLQMKDCLATQYSMNNEQTTVGGYASSKMRTETLPTLKALLPQTWQDVIKLVDKKSANGGSTYYSETLTTSEDLFLLAEIEVFNTSSKAQDGTNEGSIYEYWVGKRDRDRQKKYDQDADGIIDTTAIIWWLRSSSSASAPRFCMVSSGGSNNIELATVARGVSFAFCV